jgi:DNA invertase Pin-like site-specific DNA recombinase
VAEFERGIIRERGNAGIATAKQRGVDLGRPRTLQGRQAEAVKLNRQALVFALSQGSSTCRFPVSIW